MIGGHAGSLDCCTKDVGGKDRVGALSISQGMCPRGLRRRHYLVYLECAGLWRFSQLFVARIIVQFDKQKSNFGIVRGIHPASQQQDQIPKPSLHHPN